MMASKLKASLVLSIIAIALMIFSLFGSWYVWESENQEGNMDDGDYTTRTFSRDWKLHEAEDNYEYRIDEGSDDFEVYSDTVYIQYDGEERVYRGGQWNTEEKFGSDYENSVKTFYLTFYLVIVAIAISLLFIAGLAYSFLKNTERSNIVALGGLAMFFCLLPSLLLIMTIETSATNDNENYSIASEPSEYDEDEYYRYELEGSMAETEFSGYKGSANVTFNERDYETSWKPGTSAYLPLVSGILCIVSMVLVMATSKDYFSHRTPYHPRNIPAPVLVTISKKGAIPVCLTVVIFFLMFFMMFFPLWNYDYDDKQSGEDIGDDPYTIDIIMEAKVTTMKMNVTIMDPEGEEYYWFEQERVYTDDDNDVMDWTMLFYYLALAFLIIALPTIFFMLFGKLDLRNGLPLLLIPALFLFLTPMYFMMEFPEGTEEEFSDPSDEGFFMIGSPYDGSFIGSGTNNSTSRGITNDAKAEWGPGIAWYAMLASGIIYMAVPLMFIKWRDDLCYPNFTGKLVAPLTGSTQLPFGSSGIGGAGEGMGGPPQTTMAVPGYGTVQPQTFGTGVQGMTVPMQTQPQAQPQSQPQSQPYPQTLPQPQSQTQQTTQTPALLAATCSSCGKQFAVAEGTTSIACPFCGVMNHASASPPPSPG